MKKIVLLLFCILPIWAYGYDIIQPDGIIISGTVISNSKNILIVEGLGNTITLNKNDETVSYVTNHKQKKKAQELDKVYFTGEYLIYKNNTSHWMTLFTPDLPLSIASTSGLNISMGYQIPFNTKFKVRIGMDFSTPFAESAWDEGSLYIFGANIGVVWYPGDLPIFLRVNTLFSDFMFNESADYTSYDRFVFSPQLSLGWTIRDINDPYFFKEQVTVGISLKSYIFDQNISFIGGVFFEMFPANFLTQ